MNWPEWVLLAALLANLGILVFGVVHVSMVLSRMIRGRRRRD